MYYKFSLFIKYNFLLSSIIFLLFLNFNEKYNPLIWIFDIFAIISTSATLYLIFFLVFVAFVFAGRLVFLLSGFVFVFTNLALIIDFFIYRIWKFHINSMVINILSSPDSMDSMQWGIATTLSAVGVIAFLIYFEFYIYKKIQVLSYDTTKTRVKNYSKYFIPLFFLIVLSDKIVYGFANMYQKLDILESTKVIPLYQPMDFTGTMEDVFGLKASKKEQHQLGINENSKLSYPKKALETSMLKPVNIFVVFIDSLRYDMLKKDIMPNAADMMKDSVVFKNHYSGGNNTRFGIFSFFYGINSSYWFSFLNAQKAPVFFDVLDKFNYQSHIFSTTKTSWPEFDRTVYYSLKDKISDKYSGVPYKKDKEVLKDAISWLDEQNSSKSIFSFIFLDAPHGYSAPDNFRKFLPDYGEINYMSIDKNDREAILNQYKNSIYYDDMLFGKFISSLKDKGMYENSIIILSADHGQEIFEHGKIGHNSAYNLQQTKVPLIIHFPKSKHKEIDSMTSHLDIIPTILSYMGLKNSTEDYSNGYNIFDKNFHRDYVYLGNWNENAIITQKYSYSFSNLPNEMFRNEIHDIRSYKKVKKVEDEKIEPILMKVLDENRRFIR